MIMKIVNWLHFIIPMVVLYWFGSMQLHARNFNIAFASLFCLVGVTIIVFKFTLQIYYRTNTSIDEDDS